MQRPSVSSRFLKLGLLAAAATLALLSFISSACAEEMHLIRDEEIEQDLRTFCKPIFQQAGVSQEAVRFILVDKDELNAFVAGGQNIFIYSGLLLATTSPNEVFGVVAHETGHIAHGDLFRMREDIKDISLETLLMSVVGLAGAAATGSGDAAGATLSAAGSLGQRVVLRHSREVESAADQAGVRFLDEAHLPMDGFLSFMEKLKNQELLPESAQSEYVQTHPLTQDRISFLESAGETEAAKHYTAPPEWTEMHARMKAKLLGYIYPDRALQDRSNSIAAQYGRAIATYRQGKGDKAVALMEPLIKAEPQNPYFHEQKAQVLFENGHIDDAIDSYAKAVQYAPTAGLIRAAYGHALLETTTPARTAGNKNINEAIRQFELALRNESHSPEIQHFLAIAYGKAGNEGAMHLHLSEEALMEGHNDLAFRQAKLARQNLPKGSAGWQRSDDILDAAIKAQKDKKKN